MNTSPDPPASDHDVVRPDSSARRALLDCWRCDDVVEARCPWPHWRKVWLAWCGAILVLAVLSPIMGADQCVMIPTMMGIIVAGGPIYRYSRERPICTVCSAELDPTRRQGTGVRVKTVRRGEADTNRFS